MTRPAQTPWGEVIPLHRGVRPTTIELSYARQGKAFRADPIDLRVNQLNLQVHPPIAWWEVAIMCVVAAVIGAMLAIGSSF
jgi:hypothetical protein